MTESTVAAPAAPAAATDKVRTKEDVMRQALEEAQIALATGEVPVGCVFVEHDNWASVLATGHNATKRKKNVCSLTPTPPQPLPLPLCS